MRRGPLARIARRAAVRRVHRQRRSLSLKAQRAHARARSIARRHRARRWAGKRWGKLTGRAHRRWARRTVRPQTRPLVAAAPAARNPAPPPAAPIPVPVHARPISHTTGRTQHAMSHQATKSAGDGTQPIARFDPQDGQELMDFMDSLPDDYFQTKADNVRILAERMAGEMPVEAPFVDVMRQLAAIEARAAENAREALGVFYREHEREIQRIKQPRPGERKWNVPV